MHVLTCNRVTNDLFVAKLCKHVELYGACGITAINFIVDISQPLPVNINRLVTTVSIDLVDLNKFYNAELLDNLVLDLVELRKTVILFNNKGADADKLDQFLSICSEYGLSYVMRTGVHLEPPQSILDMSYQDISILYELFGIKPSSPAITPSQAGVRITLAADGVIVGKDGDVKADLMTDSLIKALTTFTESEREDLLSIESYEGRDGDFEICMYGPEFYATEHSDLMADILDYKYAVFDVVKNIDPSEYPLLTPEAANLLSRSGYVRLDDILKILG